MVWDSFLVVLAAIPVLSVVFPLGRPGYVFVVSTVMLALLVGTGRATEWRTASPPIEQWSLSVARHVGTDDADARLGFYCRGGPIPNPRTFAGHPIDHGGRALSVGNHGHRRIPATTERALFPHLVVRDRDAPAASFFPTKRTT